MDARNSVPHAPACCHRCQRPMVFSAREVVEKQVMNVFRCEHCHTLEAFPDDATEDAA